jgi:dimethylargininase
MTNRPSWLALTREISPALEHCELTHLARSPIDVTRARAELEAYEGALRDLGCEVRRLPAAPDMPDSVFVEDAAVVLDELAVITRPGAASRRAETGAVADAIRRYRPVAAILAPGTLDGGDVLRVGRTLFVGVGSRTNESGVAQFRRMVASQGYSVEPVAFQGCLHLKTGATLVADDLLLVNPAWVNPAHLGSLRAIEVDPDEPFAANALRIGDVVIYPAEHARTRERLEAEGISVRTVPMAELAKAEGGVTCISVLIAR